MKRIADLFQFAGGVALVSAGFTIGVTVGLVVLSVVLVVGGVLMERASGAD